MEDPESPLVFNGENKINASLASGKLPLPRVRREKSAPLCAPHRCQNLIPFKFQSLFHSAVVVGRLDFDSMQELQVLC